MLQCYDNYQWYKLFALHNRKFGTLTIAEFINKYD